MIFVTQSDKKLNATPQQAGEKQNRAERELSSKARQPLSSISN